MAVQGRRRSNPKPLDVEALEELALRYAGRYATTRARLSRYLERKVRERGWAEEAPPPFARLAERMATLGYVDDRAYASARAASLTRRGYGEGRVRGALRAAGIADTDADEAREEARKGAWDAALRLAERRRIGPFASAAPSREERERSIAILLRAGHSLEHARRLALAAPGEIPSPDGR